MEETEKNNDGTQPQLAPAGQPATTVADTEAKEQGIPVASLSFLSNIQPDFWDSFD